jgi:hypothetical protein
MRSFAPERLKASAPPVCRRRGKFLSHMHVTDGTARCRPKANVSLLARLLLSLSARSNICLSRRRTELISMSCLCAPLRHMTVVATREAVSVGLGLTGVAGLVAGSPTGVGAGVPASICARVRTGIVARIAGAGVPAGVGARGRAGVRARGRAGVGARGRAGVALRGRARVVTLAGIGARGLVTIRLTRAAGLVATRLLALGRTGVAGMAMAARVAPGCWRERPPRLAGRHAAHTRERETDVEVKLIVVLSTHPP